jgi:hypothetical protein
MSGQRRKVSDDILDGWAGGVSYQFRVTVTQLGTLVGKYGNEMPAGFADATEDALLEASLIHLRALDDFFTSRSESAADAKLRDVRAIDWLGAKWPGELWLDPAVRSLINWKVAHLTVVSGIQYEWRLATLGQSLCGQITAFLTLIGAECPLRLPAFMTVSDPNAVIARWGPVFHMHA